MNRIIGIDFGLSKVGVAISDPSGIISMPLEVIRYKQQKDLVESLKKIASEKNVKTLVIGYPLNMNYKENKMTDIIDKFKTVMEENDFEIHLEDERLSSQYAKKIMIQQNIKTGHNKEMVDILSASIILQTYLDRKK
ncbi:MAG: Holliday junction resolvase RuvX [Candidatus Marinimicrobia bacterium]|jgi:putative Holliday junction resolvase|nr:Holliday junction resolvase RuvX [Gammaproteobacteria bacterium]MBL6911454.1 Holliday junction resolvase RuvX [Candidatus Neomarinimicrobiota bacterium]MBT3728006.1 Holliday junction resolvase RuvX [Candidatus Neomarinimicrobiota bacterium]MBT3944139.1 Holliday junction resolvase RuvX [Candidatus Neomarinimicrobiota bacterium]MBT4111705.1 Holliday junction resolvase RuvX [Candidatus Neomarinimicrobiota bacterium]